MQSRARKFNFKMKEEENLNISSDPSVLKFHHAKVDAPLKIVEKSPRESATLKLKDNGETEIVKKKKFKNNNYFGVKNHIDLFEVGKHYTNLLDEGKKSLAFFGDQKASSVHHSILGVASFFNYHKNIKATVFVEKFQNSELANFLKPTHIEVELINEEYEDDSYESYACDGLEIIELCKLRHLAHKVGAEVFHQFLTNKIVNSEIVFWDLPEASTIDQEREFFLPIISVIDSISLVVDVGVTQKKKIEEITEFAKKYQVEIDGALLYTKSKK